jgi:hypothetical protein
MAKNFSIFLISQNKIIILVKPWREAGGTE